MDGGVNYDIPIGSVARRETCAALPQEKASLRLAVETVAEPNMADRSGRRSAMIDLSARSSSGGDSKSNYGVENPADGDVPMANWWKTFLDGRRVTIRVI